MIKLSESESYKKYSLNKALGKYDLAEAYLKEVVSEINIHVSYLYRCLGDLSFEKGDVSKSLEFYDESIVLDAGSLLSKLEYTKFLAFKITDIEKAKNIANEIIEACNSQPFQETEEDFGSDYYKTEAEKILHELQS